MTGSATRPRRPWPLRILRGLAKTVVWTLLVVVLLAALAFGFLQTRWGKDLVRDVVIGVLDDTFKGRIEVDRIDGFLPFDAELTGVRVFDPDGHRVLSVASVSTDFRPLELFDSSIHLVNVVLTRPEVALFDAEGRMALARAFEPRTPPTESAPSPWKVRFEGVRLDDGRLDGLIVGQDLALAELGIDLTLAMGPDGLRWPQLLLQGRVVGESELAAALGERLVVRSEGALVDGELRLPKVEISSGFHTIELAGKLGLGEVMTASLDLRSLVIDMDHLPRSLAALVGSSGLSGDAEGRGEAQLTADGSASLELTLSTAAGLLVVQGGAGLRTPGTPGFAIGDWVLTLSLLDGRAPPALAERLPAEVQDARTGLSLEARGHGLPMAPGASAHLELDADLIGPDGDQLGHLELVGNRVQDRDDPAFAVDVEVESLPVQPWLGMIGEPELLGEMRVLTAHAVVVLPPDAPPELSATATFDVSARGPIKALGRRIEADPIAGSATIQWDGFGLPTGRVDLDGRALGFDVGHAAELSLAMNLVSTSADARTLGVVGRVRGKDLRWEDARVAELDLPLDFVLDLDRLADKGARGAPIPTGKLTVHASGVELPASLGLGTAQRPAKVGSLHGDLTLSDERGGLRIRGALSAGSVALITAGAPVAARQSNLSIDTWLGPGPDGTSFAGPVTARLRGTIEGASHGARRVSRLSFEDLALELARGSGGAPSRLGARGVVRAAGVVTPEVSAESASVTLDLGLDLASVEAKGTAVIDARKVSLPSGQRFDEAHLEAHADGSEIRYEGRAMQLVKRMSGAPLPSSGDPAQEPASGASASVSKAFERLEVTFSGVVVLPSRHRPIDARVTSLSVRRGSDGTELIAMKDIHYDADGWIDLGAITLRPGKEGGTFALKGRFRPSDGAVEAQLDAVDLSIATWLDFARRALTWAALPPFVAPAVAGRVDLHLSVGGRLSAPTGSVDLSVADLAWGSRSGASLTVGASLDDEGVRAKIALAWHAESRLNAELALPARLSLSPASLAWRDERDLRVHVALSERDLSRTFAWIEAAAGRPINAASIDVADGQAEIGGAVELDLLVDGTPAAPRLETTVLASPLHLGAWRDGSLTLRGSTQGGATTFSLKLEDRLKAAAALIKVELPMSLPRALRQPDPVAWVRAELMRSPFSVKVNVPRVALEDAPFGAFVPLALADSEGEVDLSLSGTLVAPRVDGHVLVSAPEASPIDLAARLDFGTRGDLVDLHLVALRPDGDPLLDGLLTLPGLGSILQSPSSAAKVLEDPRLELEVFSAEIASLDVWEVNPGFGDLAGQLFPDGRLMVNASAHGAPGGLVADVLTRIRTIPPAGQKAPTYEPIGAARRNAADDVRIHVGITPERVVMSAVVLQDLRAVMAALSIQAELQVGSRALVAGLATPITQAPLSVKIAGGDFRLEGFAAAFRSVLGASGGYAYGGIDVGGTLAAPTFAGSFSFQFQPINIAPLGIEHDRLAATLEFPSANHYRFTAEHLFEETRTTERLPVVRCDVPLPGNDSSHDFTRLPYLVAAIEGDLSAFDPKKITLGGCIGLRDYRVLAKPDMRARVDGELRLAGSIDHPEVRGQLEVVEGLLAPALASKSVRAIGTPLDVTIVRGPPVAPAVRVEKNPYKTSVTLAVKLKIAKDKVRLEPSLVQPYGEVRALLYPDGELDIRTVDGELSLVGTIFVRKETVFLYGKTFTVDPDSRVDFLGDMSSDPQLRFTARYNIAHVDLSSIGLATNAESEVVVQVTGTPTEPVLQFTSTPAMDETNILSVIALGAPAGGGEAFDDAASQLLTAVMGMATLQFARDFQQRLALDVLRIEARSADPTDTRLTVGKRLAENLTVNYYLNLAATRSGEDVHAGSIDYRLTRYLSVLARAGDAGDVRLELNLRFQDSTPKKVTRPSARATPRPRVGPDVTPNPIP